MATNEENSSPAHKRDAWEIVVGPLEKLAKDVTKQKAANRVKDCSTLPALSDAQAEIMRSRVTPTRLGITQTAVFASYLCRCGKNENLQTRLAGGPQTLMTTLEGRLAVFGAMRGADTT